MAAERRSLAITDAYRGRHTSLIGLVTRAAKLQWAHVTLDKLDEDHARWADTITAVTTQAQLAAGRLAAAYLAGYVSSETARRKPPPRVPRDRVGVTPDGRAVREALNSPLIGVKVALSDGKAPTDALRSGLERGIRLAGGATAWASHGALSDLMADDHQIVGWRRVTSGGCGACIAAATGAIHADDELIESHSNCECTMEPVVRDAPERFPRTTGPELFEALSAGEQDARVGPAAGELLRAGEITYSDLIARSPMATEPDQITQAPVSGR